MSAYEATGTRLSGRGDHAQLLQEAEGVPHFPRLGDLAALHPVDGDGVHRDLLAGGRDAVDLGDVRPASGPAHDDAVTGREDLLDPPMTVDALLVHLHHVGHALRTGASRYLWIVHDVRLGEELGRELVLAL